MGKSKAYTKEEVQELFLNHIHALANYWANQGKSTKDACDGLAFSILNIFDGTTVELPAMNISVEPHPDDKKFHQDNDEQWFKEGMVFNDNCCLHELWYKSKD